jgi:hypothetical protein
MTEVELYVGHHMNHDFQFFFNVLPHPEVDRFFTYVKEWLHKRMDIREKREASLVRQHSLLPTDPIGRSPCDDDDPAGVGSTEKAAEPPVKEAAPPLVEERTPTDGDTLVKAKDGKNGMERLLDRQGVRPKRGWTSAGEGEVEVTVLESGAAVAGFFGRQLRERFDDEDAEAVRTLPTPLYLA